MDAKDLLKGLLSKAYKMDDTGVASLFNEDDTVKDGALESLLKADTDRSSEIATSNYSRAKKEVMGAHEKEVKEKLGISSSKTGIDLYIDIIEQKTPKATEITEEQVKKHKAYLDLKEGQEAAITNAVRDKQKELDDFKNGIERSKILAGAGKEAVIIFKGMKPVLSSDAAKAEKQTDEFVKRHIESKNWRDEGNGKYALVNEKGDYEVDNHSNRIYLSDYVKQTAGEYYDFQQADPKGSAGNGGNNGGGGGNQGKQYVVRDEADFNKQFAAATTNEDRSGISKAWRETQAAAN